MKTIGIAGGTGFLGRHLAQQLQAAGYSVIIFSRSVKPAKGHTKYAKWDPAAGTIDLSALQSLDGLINLAGAGIADKRWTKSRKLEILQSRVQATNFLVSQIKQSTSHCKVFVSASAVGFYGADTGGLAFEESDEPGHDFLAGVCTQWEAAALNASGFCRTLIFRFGVILGKEGGAYPKLVQPLKMGILPIIGKGNQYMPWIELSDLASMIIKAIETDSFSGIYNAVAPQTITNLALMKTIAQVKGGKKMVFHLPAFFLKILLGESSIELLKSSNVSCKRVIAAGFEFKYPKIKEAVLAIEEQKIQR